MQSPDRKEDTHSQPKPPKRSGLRSGGLLGGGFVLGLLVAGVLVWQLMPGMMIQVHPSRYGLDETVSRLESAAKEQGWIVAGVRNMNRSLEKHGRNIPQKVRLVEVCQPEYANSILSGDRHVATLMPCAFAVYEGDDGQVYVSNMNTGLMGKLFGGNIARIMGGRVGPEEHAMLRRVTR